MNGKERVRAAISRKPVDKVPLGLYCVDHDIVEKVIGRPTFVRNKLRIKLALAAGCRDEVAQSLKEDTVEFYRKIDCVDLIAAKEAALLPSKDYEPENLRKIAENKWEDGQGRIWQAVAEVNDIMCIYDPTPKEYSVEDFAEPEEVKPPDPSVFEALDYLITHLGEDRYICSYVPITAFTILGGFENPGCFENSMMIYALHPEIIHAANRQSVVIQNEQTPYYIRPGSSGAMAEQDMAGTNGPFVSPKMFREMCLPYLKERVRNIKKYTDQLILHNCGMNIPLMDMFIEAGIDCYQSLQTTAGMDIDRLKGKFGDKLSFWGGVPVELLIDGTPTEVRKAVRTALEKGAPGGGFILGPSHSIAKGTKYDNFMAMLDEYSRVCDKF